jgi:hypothetical protein
MNPGQLPNHPFKSFREISAALGERNIASPFARKCYSLAMEAWNRMFGIDAKLERVEEACARGEDGYGHADWTFPSMFQPEYNCSFILQPDAETRPAHKAAQLIQGALAFHSQAFAGTLAPEFEGGKPLDLSRYKNLFSRLLIPAKPGFMAIQTLVEAAPTDYVIVAAEGSYYRLPVLSSGAPISWRELTRELALILEDARAHRVQGTVAGASLGLLTIHFNRANTARFKRLVAANPETFKALDEALFVVAIHPDLEPEGYEETIRSIHTHAYEDRDHRRGMYLVVTGNGRAGVVVHPQTGAGGTLSAKFTDFLYGTCSKLQHEPAPRSESPAASAPPRFERLELNYPKGWQQDLARTRAEVESHFYPPEFNPAVRLNRIGRRDFSREGISADAAFHCALHLAYARLFGSTPSVGNFVNVRGVRHGDIWRYISTTPQMRAFVEQPSADTLFPALEEHVRVIKAQKKADDDFYLGVFAIMKLMSDGDIPIVAALSLLRIMKTFIPDFERSFLNPHIWVSHIPALPGLESAGRPCVHLGYLASNSFGGHYLMYEDHIKVCIVSSLDKNRSYAKERQLVEALETALVEVRAIVASAPGRQSQRPIEAAVG